MHPARSLLKSVVERNLEGFVWCSDELIALPAARVHPVAVSSGFSAGACVAVPAGLSVLTAGP